MMEGLEKKEKRLVVTRFLGEYGEEGSELGEDVIEIHLSPGL